MHKNSTHKKFSKTQKNNLKFHLISYHVLFFTVSTKQAQKLTQITQQLKLYFDNVAYA